MRKILIILLLSLTCFSLSASDPYDISLFFSPSVSWGTGRADFSSLENGISARAGANFGLSRRWEMSAGVTSSLVPLPFEKTNFFLEFSVSLLGERTTESRVSGSPFNMMISLGGLCALDFSSGKYVAAGPYISITPFVIGNPLTGRRERLLKTDAGYDAVNNRFFLVFSLISLDYYVRGSYRDYF